MLQSLQLSSRCVPLWLGFLKDPQEATLESSEAESESRKFVSSTLLNFLSYHRVWHLPRLPWLRNSSLELCPLSVNMQKRDGSVAEVNWFCLSPPFRWNVIGFQGSLMSYFTEPIYFSSIILGSLYHADHLSRAMYQRIADIDDLPQSFSLNRPLLSGEDLRALEGFPLNSRICCIYAADLMVPSILGGLEEVKNH